MTRRKLGRSDLSISPVVFGGNVFGWSADEKTSFALLDAFVDAGFNAIDTADSYSHWVLGNKGGESETIIGRWLKARGRRDDVLIFTKVGSDMGSGKSLKRGHVLRAAEDSLRRLQTDTIDLYQTHFDDPDTPVEETLQAYATLIEQGKVRGIGMAKNLNPRGLRILDALDAVARRHAATPAQIALAWLLARPSITAPIVSATSLAQLAELLKSLEIKLGAEDVAALNQASAEPSPASAT